MSNLLPKLVFLLFVHSFFLNMLHWTSTKKLVKYLLNLNINWKFFIDCFSWTVFALEIHYFITLFLRGVWFLMLLIILCIWDFKANPRYEMFICDYLDQKFYWSRSKLQIMHALSSLAFDIHIIHISNKYDAHANSSVHHNM